MWTQNKKSETQTMWKFGIKEQVKMWKMWTCEKIKKYLMINNTHVNRNVKNKIKKWEAKQDHKSEHLNEMWKCEIQNVKMWIYVMQI